MNDASIEIVTWQAVAAQMRALNPVFAQLIDDLGDLTNDYPLVKVLYSFGDLMIQDGKLQLPQAQGKLLPIDHPELNPILHKHLSYSPIPLCMTLNKNCEVFIQEGHRTIPLNILHPGQLFGTFEIVDFMLKQALVPIWNVSAGARATFMLPKINEASGLKRLRAEYQLSLDTQSKSFWDQWSIFKQIAQNMRPSPWKSEVIFFSEDWFKQRVRANKAWSAFYDYLFQAAWRQAQYAMSEFKFGYFWQQCIQAITERKLKPGAYAINTVKHLWAIAMGLAPGFRPVQGCLDLPLAELQKAFVDIYRLEHYWPTMLCASLLNGNLEPVYYSLSLPTLFYGSDTHQTSLMVEIRLIKLIMDHLKKYLMHHPLVRDTHFEYFHTDTDIYADIQSSQMIPKEDLVFMEAAKVFPERSFCLSSAFWRGCIRIKSSAPKLEHANCLIAPL